MINGLKRKSNPLLSTKSASLSSQKAWAGFTLSTKSELRKLLPDTDKDGVPNLFDCHPKNKKLQEAFLSKDMSFIKKNKDIQLSKKLGAGMNGVVHKVKANSRLVAKVPRVYKSNDYGRSASRYTREAHANLIEEAEMYRKWHLENEPLFIPTHTKVVNGKTMILRPSVTVIVNYVHDPKDKDPYNLNAIKISNRHAVTEKALHRLHDDLQKITEKGFRIQDGLQIGINNSTGYFVLYDFGFLQKLKPMSPTAFRTNNHYWKAFIAKFEGGTARYGVIEPKRRL